MSDFGNRRNEIEMARLGHLLRREETEAINSSKGNVYRRK